MVGLYDLRGFSSLKDSVILWLSTNITTCKTADDFLIFRMLCLQRCICFHASGKLDLLSLVVIADRISNCLLKSMIRQEV